MRACFLVDRDLCIACGLCHERAPENLEIDGKGMHAHVRKQPTSDTEEKACLEAAEYCPTGGLQTLAADDADA